jgi:hypothetical protein
MSTTFPAIDPYTQVCDAIRDCLKACKAFTDRVKEGNIVTYIDGAPNPVKDEVIAADFPEVRVVQTTSDTNLPCSSSSTKCTETFSIQLAGGSLKAEVVNAVRFAMLCALTNLQQKLDALLCFGKQFARVARVGKSTTGQTQSDLLRGIKGFTNILDITIDMYFTTADLKGVL